MFTNDSDGERGQVGIGTLIVFIAMVLVAAIAAGVLINTAGFLQTQAEATGEESTEQVSDRLSIVSASGDVSDDDAVETLYFTVATAPGSDPIDLEQTTLQLIGTEGEETFTLEDDQIDDVQGMEGNVLVTTSDRAEVELDLGDEGDDVYPALEEDARVTAIFTTDAGASTEYEIRAPSTFIDDTERF
ncbi:flagellin [Halobacteria archaeon AArc-dxtr1]|nr:flagellin [Halobacteria archaeon AArc-dxtr1]